MSEKHFHTSIVLSLVHRAIQCKMPKSLTSDVKNSRVGRMAFNKSIVPLQLMGLNIVSISLLLAFHVKPE